MGEVMGVSIVILYRHQRLRGIHTPKAHDSEAPSEDAPATTCRCYL